MVAPRGPRADAVRNRANILRAARELLAAHGEKVGVDDVARAAGVAVGTLYRHFPTKSALVDAIVAELRDRIVGTFDEAVANIDAGRSAFAELTRLAERVAAVAGRDGAGRAALGGLGRLGFEAGPGTLDRALAALTRIVEAGHAEGSLRPDVTAADLALTMGTLPGNELPEAARRRWVELALRGLTAGTAHGGEAGRPGAPVAEPAGS